MKTVSLFLSVGLTVLMGFVKAENLNDLDTVLHDPFQKSVFMKPSVQTEINEPSSQSFWKPHLIMTLRAGKNSMVNVAGQIVGLGEKIDDYTLIAVHERSAVFVKRGKIVRLTIDDEE